MSLVYIEYFSRRPGVELDAFRAGVAEGRQGWDSGYEADRLVLNAGRTWRLGPEPEYFSAWYCPGAGCERPQAPPPAAEPAAAAHRQAGS